MSEKLSMSKRSSSRKRVSIVGGRLKSKESPRDASSESSSEQFANVPALERAELYKELLPKDVSEATGEAWMESYQIGKYTLTKLLGQGGEGAVYLAHLTQASGGKKDEFVLKRRRCLSLEEVNQSFMEAMSMAQLSVGSAFVAQYEEVFITEAEPEGFFFWLVLQFCNGGDLSRRIVEYASQGAVLSLSLFKTYLQQMLRGLAAVHEAGLIHRDLKPENIFISHGVLKIGDFGLAQRKASKINEGGPAGSYFYNPPEPDWGVSGDLFSLGLIALDLACSRLFWFERQQAGLSSVGQEAAADPRWTPDVLLAALPDHLRSASGLLGDMLSRDPMARSPARVLLRAPLFTAERRKTVINLSALPLGFSVRLFQTDDEQMVLKFLQSTIQELPQYRWAFKETNLAKDEVDSLFLMMSTPVTRWALKKNQGFLLEDSGQQCIGFSFFLPPAAAKEVSLKMVGTANTVKLMSQAESRELSLWSRWIRKRTQAIVELLDVWFVWGIYVPPNSSELDHPYERALLEVVVENARPKEQTVVAHAFSVDQISVLKDLGFKDIEVLFSDKWPHAPPCHVMIFKPLTET